MKESINPGGVKSVSASPLRAFSGAPKCVNDGPINYTYTFPILYHTSLITNGTITMLSSPSIGQPPTARPFGTWLLEITIDIQNRIPPSSNAGVPLTSMGLSIMEGVGNSVATGDGRLLTSASGGGAWEKQFVTDFLGQKFQIDPNTTYNVGSLVNVLTGFGPDLLTLAAFDLSKAEKTTASVVLPEQSDFCFYRFYPFLSQTTGSVKAWHASADGVGNISGWGASGYDMHLYPDFTQIGTITLAFHRLQVYPLFHSRLLPPRTFTFTNDTFYNTSIPPVWDWDFGDGSAHSNAVSPPRHTYSNPGSYRVTLTTSDLLGVVRKFDQTVLIPFKAGFTAKLVQFAPGGVTSVIITDTSLGAVTWDYDWGDGSAHDNNQNVTHVYPAGVTTFTITQKIGDGFGNFDSATETLHL